MIAKIMIVIEIQIIFPLFSSSTMIFIISSLAVRTLGNSVGVAKAEGPSPTLPKGRAFHQTA